MFHGIFKTLRRSILTRLFNSKLRKKEEQQYKYNYVVRVNINLIVQLKSKVCIIYNGIRNNAKSREFSNLLNAFLSV